MSLKSENTATINRLFKQAVKDVDLSVREGFEYMLELGVLYCLEEHDARHQNHLEIGDSYGWMLVRNGRKVSMKIHSASVDANANAVTMLSAVKKKVSKTGYVGIVLAGMQPFALYSEDYEFLIMRRGMSKLEQRDFGKYFKQVVI